MRWILVVSSLRPALQWDRPVKQAVLYPTWLCQRGGAQSELHLHQAVHSLLPAQPDRLRAGEDPHPSTAAGLCAVLTLLAADL